MKSRINLADGWKLEARKKEIMWAVSVPVQVPIGTDC